ncbi:MAG: DUF99 family protein [Desulfurococcales archaeon]|nr:DUF99 family protein [Desulfurococcales archaeon]
MGTVLAVDDGYFLPEYKSLRGYSPVVGIVGHRSRIYGIAIRKLLVDSMDIEDILVDIFRDISRIVVEDIDAIICDNVIYGGFSIYDPWRLNKKIGVPVIVIFSHSLDLTRIRMALENHFEDYVNRYALIEKSYRSSRIVVTPRGHIRVLCVELGWGECLEIIIDNQTYHPLPQPLRHADIIASAIGRILAMKPSSTKV